MRTVQLFAVVALSGLLPSASAAQELPLAPLRGSEQGVWPAYEGWYDAGDGTYVLYFGYNNRNADDVVEIPLGEQNFIEPARFDGAQPTHFEPRRDWGVFGIRVPADFPRDERIYWNLVLDGRTYRVPGHLQADYKTDALGGGAANAFPPRLTVGGVEGAGPMGPTAPHLHAKVGQGVQLTVAARQEGATTSGLAAAFGALAGGGADAGAGATDEARPPGRGRGGAGGEPPGGGGDVDPAMMAMMARGAIQVSWFKHQGPGVVTFSSPTARVTGREGEASTVATFSEPGTYVVRVRANGSDIAGSGHAQCCWSNAYYEITVTR